MIPIAQKPYIALLLGWLTSRVLSLLRPLAFWGTVVLPGFYVAVLYVFLLTQGLFGRSSNSPRSSFLVPFGAGVLADSLFYWVVRPGTGASISISGPWDPAVLVGSAAGGVLAVFVLLLGTGLRRRARARMGVPTTGHVLAGATGLLVTVVLFRVAYLMTRHLPNEERSIMIAGCEVHHAYLGALALLVLGLLANSGIIGNGRIVFLFLGAVSGFVLDQLLYIPQADLSDIAYGGALSWAGAVLGTVAQVGFLVWSLKRTRTRHGDPEAA